MLIFPPFKMSTVVVFKMAPYDSMSVIVTNFLFFLFRVQLGTDDLKRLLVIIKEAAAKTR